MSKITSRHIVSPPLGSAMAPASHTRDVPSTIRCDEVHRGQRHEPLATPRQSVTAIATWRAEREIGPRPRCALPRETSTAVGTGATAVALLSGCPTHARTHARMHARARTHIHTPAGDSAHHFTRYVRTWKQKALSHVEQHDHLTEALIAWLLTFTQAQ